MADIKDFKHAIVRQKILDAVRKDLIGPASDCEQLNEVPTSSYITGLLYPADTDVTEDENYNEVEFIEKNFDADGETLEAGIFEEEEPEDRVKGGFQKPSSIGVSFYVSDDVQKVNAYINWGKYYAEQVQGEVIDETLEEDAENKKKKKYTMYIREQMNDVVEIDFNEMGRSKQIPLESNGNIYIYVMKMQLDNGYKMVSVYLHNNDKSDGNEKEYEKVMFQVEMLIADDLMSPIFVPEYLCRKVELEDEYYYKGRPVYARGRGCAATWEKKAEEINATAIKSSFIPDYEIPSVSAQIDDMPEHAFSMLQMGSPKKKSEVIQNLRTLTEMYGSWITDVLTNDEAMHDDKFKATGQTIIDKCNDANRRMNAGIDLIENNDKVYQAFVFMNQAMYLQRSITAFSKDYGNGMDQYKKNQGEVKCPKCGYPAYPSRFITVCEDGHMDDFPWRWWVHHGETSCKEDMYLKSMGNTSSLAELRVECNCGARRVMSGAMQKEKFVGLCCSGNHPHRPGAKAKICKKSVIPSQRGASNVYFSVTRNAISIPPWTNPINDIMGAQRATIETLVEAMGEESGLLFAYQKYFGDKYSYEDFKAAYDRLSQNIKEFTELKEMEYAAITHHEDVEYQHDVKYFKAEEVTLSESLKEYISRIIKIHRLREVRVLTGFTRLEAPEPEVDEQSHIVKLKCSSGEKWLPAVEINGEGVFIELSRKKINQWMQIETVKSRSDKYEECYAAYCQKKGWENFKPRNAEYVLLHTLSHMLIKEMSMQSGYSSSALHERIYSSENMCGILIYTGAADKEGSLGGLVELGGMNKFLPLLKGALENGLTCTTDPECFMKNPTSERLNGAACHSCTMISETACENGNRLLDRALVVPVPEHEKMGYFRELVRDLCGIQV